MEDESKDDIHANDKSFANSEQDMLREKRIAFTTENTMIGKLNCTSIGSGHAKEFISPEVAGMKLLLEENLLSPDTMNMQLINLDQIRVALVAQFINVGMIPEALSMISNIASTKGKELLPWKKIMRVFAHGEIPDACRRYVLEYVDKNGHTIFYHAVKEYDKQYCVELLSSPLGSFYACYVSPSGKPALTSVIEAGWTDVALDMMKRYPNSYIFTDEIVPDEQYPLLCACRSWRMSEVASALVALGPDVCNPAAVDKEGRTALMWACYYKKMEQVALALIAMGPEVCKSAAVNIHGSTALIWACEKSVDRVALALISLGPEACNAGAVDNSGHTALDWSCVRGMSEVALVLIALGVEVCNPSSLDDDDGYTALYWACENSMDRVALALIELGPEVCNSSAVNDDGETALYWACANGMDRVASALIALGPESCNAAAANNEGRTALYWACANGMDRVALALISLGPGACNAAAANNDGKTALYWACANGMDQVMSELIALDPKARDDPVVN